MSQQSPQRDRRLHRREEKAYYDSEDIKDEKRGYDSNSIDFNC
jgi:hypothetical protein